MKNYFYSKFLLFFGVLLTIAGGISFNPTPANAIGLCSAVGTPTITVTMNSGTTSNGSSYSSDRTVTYTPVPTAVSFTVSIDSEFGSSTTITYPGGSDSTPGLTTKSFTTSSMSSIGTIHVRVVQTCQIDSSEPPSKSIDITLNPQVPVITFSASPTSGTAPLSTTLSWSATNSPTSCTASASPANSSWSGTKAVSGPQTITGLAAGTHTFNLFCSNVGGPSATRIVTVNVAAANYTVTPSVNGSGGTAAYSSSNSFSNGSVPLNATVKIDVNPGSSVDTNVQGTCPPGSFSNLNALYTTGQINTNCTVIFNFLPPSTPPNLTATPSSCGSGTINISWGSVSGATSYQLRDGTTQIYSGTGFLYSHTGLTAGSSHNYTVRATNSSGSSPWSSAVTATAPAVCPVTQPDLTAATPTVTPSSVSVNGTQTFTSIISNIGNASTGGSFSYFFQTGGALHENGATTDQPSATTTTLAAGGTRSVTYTRTWPTSGTKSVRLCVDKTSSAGGGVITESNEDNNCGGWKDVNVQAANVPVVTISASPTSGTVGTVNPTITYSATNSPTSCTATGDWISTPATATSTNKTQSQGVLNTVKTYTYNLACTNAGGTGATATATVNVTAVPFIDLTASAPSPSTAAIGTAQTFTSAITNSGNVSTGTTNFTNLFQTSPSSTGASGVTDYPVSGMMPLAAGASANISVSITFPAGTPSTMYIRACADKSSAESMGTISESNENNNCSMSTPWTVITVTPLPAPDLTASVPTPNKATIGAAQTFTSTITNKGTSGTTAAFPNFFQTSPFSTGASGVTDYVVSGPGVQPRLEAGYSTPVSVSITFPAGTPSTMYIRACADKSSAESMGTISESNENNNCSSPWTAITISPAGTMSGTLTPAATSCLISQGNSSCNINMGWSISNPETTPTAITATGMPDINVSTSTTPSSQSGTQSVTVPYSTRTFYLYNNSKSLVPTSPSGSGVVITSSCTSGTIWNNGQCRAGVNGQCATPPNGYTYTSAPSGPLCTAGTAVPSSLSGTGPWSWACNGSGVGTNASCSASYDDGGDGGDPECSNGATNYPECTIDENNICLNGAANPPICDIGIGTMGVCSTPDNHSNPCLVGTPSAITSGTSAWTWTCSASASTASCSEAKKKPIFIED